MLYVVSLETEKIVKQKSNAIREKKKKWEKKKRESQTKWIELKEPRIHVRFFVNEQKNERQNQIAKEENIETMKNKCLTKRRRKKNKVKINVYKRPQSLERDGESEREKTLTLSNCCQWNIMQRSDALICRHAVQIVSIFDLRSRFSLRRRWNRLKDISKIHFWR